MMARIAALAVGVTLAALAMAGCADRLDEKEIEGFVQSTAKDQGVKVKTVKCPDDIEAKKGVNFTCSVTAADGKRADIAVKQTSDDGNIRILRDEFAPLVGEEEGG